MEALDYVPALDGTAKHVPRVPVYSRLGRFSTAHSTHSQAGPPGSKPNFTLGDPQGLLLEKHTERVMPRAQKFHLRKGRFLRDQLFFLS